MHKHVIVLVGLLSATILAANLGQAEDAAPEAIVVRTAAIKSSPSIAAKTLTTAKVGQSVLLGTRVGGWQQITRLADQPQKGWLRTYQIRADIEPKAVVVEQRANETKALSGLAGLSRRSASLFGKRELSDSGRDLTVAMGVRGLSEADLKNAKPDQEQLVLLQQCAVSSGDARKHAKQGGLRSQKIKLLPAPKKKKRS